MFLTQAQMIEITYRGVQGDNAHCVVNQTHSQEA